MHSILTSSRHNRIHAAAILATAVLPALSAGAAMAANLHSLNIYVADYSTREPLQVSLTLRSDDGLSYSETGATSANGYYVFNNLPQGRYELAMSVSGYVDNKSFVTIGEEDVNETYYMHDTPAISGVVYKNAGGTAVVSGALVVLSENGMIVQTRMTDSRGRYIFLLHDGTYSVSAQMTGYNDAQDGEIMNVNNCSFSDNLVLNIKENNAPSEQTPTATLTHLPTTLYATGSEGCLHVYGLQPNATLFVYDLSGRIVFRRTAEDTSMNVPLPNGLYIVINGNRNQKVLIK
jgi:hypothetical protein